MDLSWRLLRLPLAVVGSFAVPLQAQRSELISSGEQGMATAAFGSSFMLAIAARFSSLLVAVSIASCGCKKPRVWRAKHGAKPPALPVHPWSRPHGC